MKPDKLSELLQIKIESLNERAIFNMTASDILIIAMLQNILAVQASQYQMIKQMMGIPQAPPPPQDPPQDTTLQIVKEP